MSETATGASARRREQMALTMARPARLNRFLPAEATPDKSCVTNPWRWAAIGAAMIVAALIGLFLFSLPLQLSDMLANLLQVQRVSWSEIFGLVLEGHPRPAIWITLKFFFELARGQEFFTFKALQAAMVLATLLLAVRLMQVRTPVDFATAAITLYIIVGMNTFYGLINEGFPINNHLTPVLGALVAANLAYSRGGLLVDLAAVLTFLFAVLSVETGLLIPVILVTAYLVGWRGVSLGAIGAIVLLAVAVFILRGLVVETGDAGSLINTTSGYGFTRYEPSELREMFAGRLYVFFLYNVGSALASVILSQPTDGRWEAVAALLNGGLLSYQKVEIISSLAIALLVGLFAVRRWRAWCARDLTHADRLVLLALAVLPANASLSFAYSKSVILATVGIFWALAAFAAIRDILNRAVSPSVGLVSTVTGVALVAAISGAFVVRAMSAHYSMYSLAISSQSDWVMRVTRDDQPKTAEERALVERLQAEALALPMPPKPLLPQWLLLYENR